VCAGCAGVCVCEREGKEVLKRDETPNHGDKGT